MGHALACQENKTFYRRRLPHWHPEGSIAGTVVDALRLGEDRRFCRLSAFVVVPNHVHLLLQPLAPLGRITHWIKGCTAYEANFWQHESYDHWVRNEEEYNRIVRYIEFNPVSAGRVGSIEEFPWSSAKTDLTS